MKKLISPIFLGSVLSFSLSFCSSLLNQAHAENHAHAETSNQAHAESQAHAEASDHEISRQKISNKLIQYSVRGRGHDILVNHPFSKTLKSSADTEKNPDGEKLSSESLAQLFIDRIYILNLMEETMLNHSPETLPKWPPKTRPEILSIPELSAFFRSSTYQTELFSLMGPLQSAEISEAAETYGAYLKTVNKETLFLHFWVWLIADTFGTQSWAHYMKKSYPTVGDALRSYDGLNLNQVRTLYNDWIEKNWPDSSPTSRDESYKAEIDTAYHHVEQLLDAAVEAKQILKSASISSAPSQRCLSFSPTKSQKSPKSKSESKSKSKSKKE